MHLQKKQSMDLSVVIVNYNVKFFLEQCLQSVQTAASGLKVEVFVVDNHSTDGSQTMLKEKFPKVRLIENLDNVGFSRANNQAIRMAKGRYVLLLNPDTIVQEDTFLKCISFMDNHLDGGGLGVKMIDGAGNFLPESKRGLPTPAVAFYKIFGLSALFPKSKKFGKYHLRYLDDHEIHEVEVLAGAFMWLRKETLDKIGLLDEDFFMYGEDIDLSYRVVLGGYKNYYFPETRIIHYKGESTKKSSVNYVFVFYRAMVIFAKKHFQKNWKWFQFFINIAIWLRAAMAIFSRAVNAILIQPFSKTAKSHHHQPSCIGIVGNFETCQQIKTELLAKIPEKSRSKIGFILCQKSEHESDTAVFGMLSELSQVIKTWKMDEVIFCASDISTNDIIQQMMDIKMEHPNYKIVPPKAHFMVGGNSIVEF